MKVGVIEYLEKDVIRNFVNFEFGKAWMIHLNQERLGNLKV